MAHIFVVDAGLLSTARAVLMTLVVTSLHSLCSVQLLVRMANLSPNQDLAFVLAVSYTALCVLLLDYFVRLANVVSPSLCTVNLSIREIASSDFILLSVCRHPSSGV